MITLNRAEIEAVQRNFPLIDDDNSSINAVSLSFDRRDSFNNPCDDGFLIMHVEFEDGGWAEDAISSEGSTSFWASKL